MGRSTSCYQLVRRLYILHFFYKICSYPVPTRSMKFISISIITLVLTLQAIHAEFSGSLLTWLEDNGIGAGYGCWCSVLDHNIAKKGPALDEFDQLCRSLELCRRCIVIDLEAEIGPDNGCDPYQESYALDALYTGECDTGLTPCSRKACECEHKFTRDLLAITNSNLQVPDASLLHDGDFNKEQQCDNGKSNESAAGASTAGDVSCCGAYPHRYPYNIAGGERACCGSEVYSTMAKTCCPRDDGNGFEAKPFCN